MQPPTLETPETVSAPTESSTNTPTSAPDLPTINNPSLTHFEMFDQMDGWGFTEDKLVITGDGGTTWTDITPAGVTKLGYSASVYFLDLTTGWLVSPNDDFLTGTLYYTTDGGSNWTSMAVPFSGGSFDFINASTGFILVGRGAAAGSAAVDIYSTSDGGVTWNAVYTMQLGVGGDVNSLPFSGQKSGFAFLDGLKGWVGGNIPMDGYIYLYTSLDGGHVWMKQNPVLPTGYESAMTEVMSPRFFNDLQGVLPIRIMTDSFTFDFYRTQDGGVTWTSTEPVIVSGQFSIASLQDIFVWDGGPILKVTQDGGQSWNVVSTNINVTDILMSMQFVDSQTGWILTGDAANHHSLYKTIDGGATWNVLIP